VKLTAAETPGNTYLTNSLKLDVPNTAYWLEQLQVNPALFEADGLAKIAAKSSEGSAGIEARQVKSSSIWQGNTAGGAMTATVSGNYTFDPSSLPIRVQIKSYTTNADGTKKPDALQYSTDGTKWADATGPASDDSFEFTVKGATVKMNVAADASNSVNDMYVITLPAGDNGNAGGDNAVKLSNLLKLTLSSTLGNASLNGFYNNLIGTLGTQSQNAINNSTNQDSLVTQTKNMRDSISGVNLDEELAAMIKFQKGYNGCARLLTAMDELLDKLINSTGMVGR
jgi:flagellar hook-associated protein 1 FlgK